MAQQQRDRWASGDLYEPYVGRWSRLVALGFLDWLKAPAGLRWLDVGCGTGALTQSVIESSAPKSVAAIDPSAGFLAYARKRLANETIDIREADAQKLPFESDSFDRVVSGLVMNFVPDQPRAAAEIFRVLAPGGEAAIYVWDYREKMEMIRRFWDAAIALDPAAEALDEGPRFALCRPQALTSLFETAGLEKVKTRGIEIETRFRDFDDYWTPFLSGQGPAPGYCVSLSEDKRERLRRRLFETLPRQPDDSISLVARAWAVRGRKM